MLRAYLFTANFPRVSKLAASVKPLSELSGSRGMFSLTPCAACFQALNYSTTLTRRHTSKALWITVEKASPSPRFPDQFRPVSDPHASRR